MSAPELQKFFEEQIVTAAKQVVGTEKKYHPDWFTQSLLLLSLHIHLQNRSFKKIMEKRIEEMQNELKVMRANLQHVKHNSKCKWQEEYMNKCKPVFF